MRIDASSKIRGKVIDRDTGNEIPLVIWANIPENPDSFGEFEAFRVDAKQKDKILREHGKPVRWFGRARMVFVPRKIVQHVETRQVAEPINLPILGDKCEHYGCTKIPEYSVSDEVILSPVVRKDGRRFEQGQVVSRRFYCAKHYTAPRIVAPNGEIIRKLEDVGTRPGWHST